MVFKFDASEQRQHWLDFGLEAKLDFRPDTVPTRALPNYVHMTVGFCIDAVFVGLLNHVLPTIDSIAEWMQGQPEPARADFVTAADDGWDVWLHALCSWREAYGLCQWLRGDNGDLQLLKATGAWVTSLIGAPQDEPELASQAGSRFLFTSLGTALAAGAPDFGLALYRASNSQAPKGPDAPFVNFGVWACDHLANGGRRDQSYVDRGCQALEIGLASKFEDEGGGTKLALWLKAILFDTGVVATAEDAILKSYDYMPGVPRPDFLSK